MDIAGIKEAEAQAFKDNCLRLGFTPDAILPHDSYLINLGAPIPKNSKRAARHFSTK